MKSENYREYKVVKIVRNDKFYWRPMYKNIYTSKPSKVYDWLGMTNTDWQWLGILIKDTDILAPAEYKHKFGAMRRVVQDMHMITNNGKFEIFEEIPLKKIKITNE